MSYQDISGSTVHSNIQITQARHVKITAKVHVTEALSLHVFMQNYRYGAENKKNSVQNSHCLHQRFLNKRLGAREIKQMSAIFPANHWHSDYDIFSPETSVTRVRKFAGMNNLRAGKKCWVAHLSSRGFNSTKTNNSIYVKCHFLQIAGFSSKLSPLVSTEWTDNSVLSLHWLQLPDSCAGPLLDLNLIVLQQV